MALTRRRFLRSGSAVLAGAALAPADMGCTSPPEYDVCIIGSGFAGLFLGLRLVSYGIRTVIVEAGPHLTPAAGTDGAVSLFPTRTEGTLGFPIDANRTIGVGGTSWKWNGVVGRLLSSDFRTRSRFGLGADWPLGETDLAPYYCEAEQALGTRGWPAVPGAEPDRTCPYPFEARGYVTPAPLFEPRHLAFFPLAFASTPQGPLRLHERHIPRFTSSAGATLLVNHPITRLAGSHPRRVSSAEARPPGGSLVEIRARQFVVCAGVVETVRLLLLSRSEAFPGGIGNGADLLGRGINAHPRYQIRLTAPDARPRPSGIHRTYSFVEEARRAGLNAFHIDAHFGSAEPILNLTVELEAAAPNRIRLDPARVDQWGRPIAVLQADWTGLDTRTIEQGQRVQRELASRIARRNARLPEPVLRWFHPAGGCVMASDQRAGVVNEQCQVFGAENLYVLGASTFPVAGCANPTLTIVALAMRLADHLRTRL